jgi:hypothetical protein
MSIQLSRTDGRYRLLSCSYIDFPYRIDEEEGAVVYIFSEDDHDKATFADVAEAAEILYASISSEFDLVMHFHLFDRSTMSRTFYAGTVYFNGDKGEVTLYSDRALLSFEADVAQDEDIRQWMMDNVKG